MGLPAGASTLGLGFILSFKAFGLNKVEQAAGALDRVDRKGEDLIKRLDRLKKTAKAGAGLLALGTGLAVGISKSVSEANKFEYAMAEVHTIIRKISDEDFAELQRKVQVLAMTAGEDPVVTARALYQTISAGLQDTKEAYFALQEAVKAGIAGVSDTFTAVDTLTSILNAYGLKANETVGHIDKMSSGLARFTGEISKSIKETKVATDIFDVFFVAVREGKTTFEQLHAGLGRVIGISKGISLSYRDVIGTVSTLTKYGLQTSEAFTGLRSTLMALRKQTERTRLWSMILGYSFDSMSVKTKGWTNFILGLNKAVQRFNTDAPGMIKRLEQMLKTKKTKIGGIEVDLKPSQLEKIELVLKKLKAGSFDAQDAIFGLMGRIEGANAVQLLMTQSGKNLVEMMKQMEKSTGASQAAFEKIQKTWKKTIDRIKSIFTVMFENIGEGVKSFLTPALLTIEKYLKRIEGWVYKNSKAVAAFLLVLTTLSIGVGSIMLISSALKLMALAGMPALSTLLPIAGIVLGIAGAVGLLIAAVYKFRSISAVINNLGDKAYEKMSLLDKIIYKVGMFVKGIVSGFLGTFVSYVVSFKEKLNNIFKNLSPIIDMIKELISVFVDSESAEGMKGFGEAIGAVGATVLSWPFEKMLELIDYMADFSKKYFGFTDDAEKNKIRMKEIGLAFKDLVDMNVSSLEKYLRSEEPVINRLVAVLLHPLKSFKIVIIDTIRLLQNKLILFDEWFRKLFGIGGYKSTLVGSIVNMLDSVLDHLRDLTIDFGIPGFHAFKPFAGIPRLGDLTGYANVEEPTMPTSMGYGFAEGGLVTSPTRMLVGEEGPEIIIPLDKLQLDVNPDGVKKFDTEDTVGIMTHRNPSVVKAVIDSRDIITAVDRRNVGVMMSLGKTFDYAYSSGVA